MNFIDEYVLGFSLHGEYLHILDANFNHFKYLTALLEYCVNINVMILSASITLLNTIAFLQKHS